MESNQIPLLKNDIEKDYNDILIEYNNILKYINELNDDCEKNDKFNYNEYKIKFNGLEKHMKNFFKKV